jgi:F420-non-reducing hydrogenase large subunit
MFNMVEMAFVAYDPCFDCNTHPLPAKMPEQATIRNAIGKPVEVLKQFC